MDKLGARFELGHRTMTPNARDLVKAHTDDYLGYIKGLLIRHRAGDWGHITEDY